MVLSFNLRCFTYLVFARVQICFILFNININIRVPHKILKAICLKSADFQITHCDNSDENSVTNITRFLFWKSLKGINTKEIEHKRMVDAVLNLMATTAEKLRTT
jgi:hypothetical protein